MITTVFIDVDDTLLNFTSSAEKAIRLTAEKLNLPCPDDLPKRFFEINKEVWKNIEKGTAQKETVLTERWEKTFGEFGINVNGKVFDEEFRLSLGGCAYPVEGAEDLLKYLSAKYDVYAASNSFTDHQVKRIKTAGFDKYLKGLFTSESIGYDKPDVRFYDECVRRANVKRENIIMIGDSPSSDVLGGINSGLKVIWFNFSNKTISVSPDYIVYKLEEIKNIL